MEHHKLGKSDLKVSELSFGCMSLELEKGQDHITDLIKKAYDSGINLFDTADLYNKGRNEEMVGKALKPFRDEVVISTKVGNQWREDGSGWDWNPSKEHILTGINESLRRLQTDHIDLYMLHGGTIDDPIDESVEAFEQLKKQGKIRAYGISSIRPNTIREWVNRSNMDCVMMQYSLLDRRPEEEALDLLAEHNISVITRGTLAKGMLIDKPAQEYLGYSADQVAAMKKALDQTKNALSASVKYVQQHPAVASVVAGIRTEEQLELLLNANEISFPSSKLQELSNVLPANAYDKHR
ncbi:aldo/keto reductase [Gracilimonas tropica]|uniref:aldo/keto reductase n=1 Tax=Gracilimonas tropica TaxID=454600 RepID=UPI0003767CF8|nr:aldo/keto reductase [Gracilimonas tropica]